MPRKLPFIEVGYDVFLDDGGDAFGAVRQVIAEQPALLINVEGAGDFRIPLDAVEKVASKKVVVRWEQLDETLQEAIRHAMDREDFPPPGEEVELVPPPPDEDEDEAYAVPDGRIEGPRDELPGRDVGSRFGAPPSTTTPRR